MRSLATLSCLLLSAGLALAGTERVAQVLPVSKVWAGHPVGFDLLTVGERQFVAFYDDQRRMTIGARLLSEQEWRLERLPSTLGWDSHNYVTIAADDDGLLHVAGNMHVNPLLYFRSERPWDIGSLRRVSAMVGTLEDRVTYPHFFRGPANELIFTYRQGQSGNGDQVLNVWQGLAKGWRRLLDKPLTNGEGRRNAYFQGPVSGPDGWWHLCWVWRESGDCATNHDLTYARSKDLVHWETSGGQPLALPITLRSGEIVDPVPVRGGIINGNTRLGFDSAKRVVIAYHKYDAAGHTQIYNARREAGGWRLYQTSKFDRRWDFSGGGSIVFQVSVGGVEPADGGKLRQRWSFQGVGGGTWLLDEATLQPVGSEARRPSVLDPFGKPEGDFPELGVRWLQRAGTQPGVRYALRWETLAANRDRPRPAPWPGPSELRLYVVRGEP
jgi:hypothetical protein